MEESKTTTETKTEAKAPVVVTEVCADLWQLISREDKDGVIVVTEAMEVPELGCVVRTMVEHSGRLEVSVTSMQNVRIVPNIDADTGDNVGMRLWATTIEPPYGVRKRTGYMS